MLLNTASIVVYVMLNKNRYISRGLFGDFRGNFGGILETGSDGTSTRELSILRDSGSL